jgi:hypothetical protein
MKYLKMCPFVLILLSPRGKSFHYVFRGNRTTNSVNFPSSVSTLISPWRDDDIVAYGRRLIDKSKAVPCP